MQNIEKTTKDTEQPLQTKEPTPGCLWRCGDWFYQWLQRAERRISENFRVPPNGG